MNKLLAILLSIVLFGCNKDSEKKKNGLTKSADEIIEYTIRIQNDLLNDEIRDTLLIANKKYNLSNFENCNNKIINKKHLFKKIHLIKSKDLTIKGKMMQKTLFLKIMNHYKPLEFLLNHM